MVILLRHFILHMWNYGVESSLLRMYAFQNKYFCGFTFFFFLVFHILFWNIILKNLNKIAINLLNRDVGRFVGACVVGLGWAWSNLSTCHVLSSLGGIPNIRQTFPKFGLNRVKFLHGNDPLLVYCPWIFNRCSMKSISQLAHDQTYSLERKLEGSENGIF